MADQSLPFILLLWNRPLN